MQLNESTTSVQMAAALETADAIGADKDQPRERRPLTLLEQSRLHQKRAHSHLMQRLTSMLLTSARLS